jgi:hypothetical protein
MGILLFLLGLLAAASGGVKLRRSALAPRWAGAELALGALTVLASGVGLARVRPLAWYVVVAVVGLLLCSTWVHVRRASTARRAREESEGRRLKMHLGATDE